MTENVTLQTATANESNSPITAAVAVVLALSLLTAGVGTVVATSSSTGDLGASYLAYKALNDDLDADSTLAGGSAVISGSGTAASGAATYVSATGTAATFGAGAAATGGLLAA
ncbi:hypothetical protein [Halapricum desulfuricans]|uniref:hypothetical protein n=1 Tax=Halapricum desulfuricans TaxID=2841257 RepID=UPI001E60192A|nr:hypothetical protein [Halapricum desulfuricans]